MDKSQEGQLLDYLTEQKKSKNQYSFELRNLFQRILEMQSLDFDSKVEEELVQLL